MQTRRGAPSRFWDWALPMIYKSSPSLYFRLARTFFIRHNPSQSVAFLPVVQRNCWTGWTAWVCRPSFQPDMLGVVQSP